MSEWAELVAEAKRLSEASGIPLPDNLQAIPGGNMIGQLPNQIKLLTRFLKKVNQQLVIPDGETNSES